MPTITFSGDHYSDGKHRFTASGTYEVDEAKAAQLLADFPDRFSRVEDSKQSAANDQPKAERKDATVTPKIIRLHPQKKEAGKK